MKRSSSRNDVLVFDFGRSATRAVHIDISGKFPRVLRFASVPRERGVREDDVLLSARKAAALLGMDEKPGAVLTWDEGIVFRQMELPVMPAEDLRKAFDWEMKQKYTIEIQDPVMTYTEVAESEQPDGTRERFYSVFYAEKRQVVARVAAVRALGYQVLAVVPGHSALANLCSGIGGDKDVLIFDIGAESARILVAHDEKNMLARSVLLGGDALTEMMADGYLSDAGRVELGFAQAERLKIAEGAQNPQAPHIGLVRPYLEKLVTEIKRSVDFYEDQKFSRPIGKVVFTGGGSDLKGLAGFMSRFVKTQVHVLDPGSFLHPSMPQDRQLAARECFGALTASLGAAIAAPSGPDLLPPEMRESGPRGIERSGLRLGVFALLLGLAAADVWAVAGYRAALGERASLETQRRETGRVHDLLIGIGAQQRFMRAALKNDLYHPGLLKQLSLAVPETVVLDEILYSRSDGQLLVRGTVLSPGRGDLRVLAKLITDLQSSPFFEEAQLISSQTDGSGHATTFEIRCRTKGVS